MARILVVDDEPHIRELLQTVLERDGHTVITAATGLEGLTAAIDALPDLILLDLVMPEVDGLAVVRALRTVTRSTIGIPIIVMTAWDTARDQPLEYGVDDFLAKPVDIKDLRMRVAAVLDAREAMRTRGELDRPLAYLQALDKRRNPSE